MTREKTLFQSGSIMLEVVAAVVVAAVLIGIGYMGIGGAIHRSRDAKRQNDLVNIKQALELYYTDNQAYPKELESLKTNGYIREVPRDPKFKDDQKQPATYGYMYEDAAQPQHYALYTRLEYKRAKQTLTGISNCDAPVTEKGNGVVNPTGKQACFRFTND
ncbi:MAG TPA: hypothetical protein VGE59_00915 [Patescibacteria group bacterium]